MSESKLLKIVSILMIIGGAATILIGIMGIGSSALLGAAGVTDVVGMPSMGLLVGLSVFGIVAGVVELVVGIVGVKNWNNPAKAGTCFIMGIVALVLSLISIVLGIVMGSGFTSGTIISILTGLVLPVLYIVGANQLKGAAK